MITVQGVDFDFSATDYRHFGRYEKAMKRAARKRSAQGLPTTARGLKKFARTYTDLIDNILGNGACNKIFGPKISDVAVVIAAWVELEAQLLERAAAFHADMQALAAQVA